MACHSMLNLFRGIFGFLISHQYLTGFASNHEFSWLLRTIVRMIEGRCILKVTIVDSKSKAVPPTICPFFSGSNIKLSVGSDNFRISHHNTCPSVEAEKNSEPT